MTGLVAADGVTPLSEHCSAYSAGGDGFGGQMAGWYPSVKSADAALLPTLDTSNARADDLVRNNAIAHGGVQMHIDNVVGSLFRPSYRLNYKLLGMEEESAREFMKDAEQAFIEYAESPACYIDAERKRTFTMLVRAIAASHCHHGEGMAVSEWISRPGAMYKTAIKLVSPKRVSNPNGKISNNRLRAGVSLDRHGAAKGYWVKQDGYNEFGSLDSYSGEWKYVPRENRWGRSVFMHIFEPLEAGQTRGANLLLSMLEQMKGLSHLQNTKIQNAIVNAMYAAVYESDLSADQAFQLLGGDDGAKPLRTWMEYLGEYHDAADIRMNGARIPSLPPGQRLKFTQSTNADNGFTHLESSMLRFIAAGFGLSYEQIARDYSKVNYSSARASLNESFRYTMGKRKVIACRFASHVFSNWLEEALHRKVLKAPKSRFNFYERKEAWTRCDWIGAGRLSIDGLKEAKEAILRIESGISTYEKELAQMGEDYHEIFAQQKREIKEREELDLPPPSYVLAVQFDAANQDGGSQQNAA
ncbi:phage portal protein [Pseudoalteromonas luteoviolacea]|uniref:phage portal protein n=1 Tax=Pseudoalteromonas luteoviolacea TaxID=43657 RepID=UPI001B369A7F|nr:phage portal protein [Pseudoalteromonas luteoviolacea]MBQ4836048.1 phage portal protein [Pseudoalteromonas luteoviolacea]